MVTVLIFAVFCPQALRYAGIRTLSDSNPGISAAKKARHREGKGLLDLNGAPSGISACGWRRPPSLRRFAPCVLRWETLARFLSFAPCRVRIPAHVQ